MMQTHTNQKMKAFCIWILLLMVSVAAESQVTNGYRPKLLWDVASGAEKYYLQVSNDSLFASTVFDDSTITNNYRQVGPLAPNRKFYWRVKAKVSEVWGAYSSADSFRTELAPPYATVSIRKSFTSPGSKPTGLASDGKNLWMIDDLGNIYKMDTSGNVLSTFAAPNPPVTDLSWDGEGLWLGDNPQHKIDSLGNPMDTLPVYYYSDSGLEWDGKFFWVGDYNFSDIYKHKPDGTLLYSFSPSGMWGHPTGISFDGINLWIADSGEGSDSYSDIYKYSTTGVLVASYDITGLGIARNWGFNCVAWDGESLWYASAEGLTIYRLNVPYYHSAPVAPVLVSPVNSATDQLNTTTFSWNESLDATSYRLQVSKAADFSKIIYDNSGITTTSQEVGGLLNSTTYYWRVCASSLNYTGSYSAVYSFTTTMYAPPTPILASPENNAVDQLTSLNLLWNAALGGTTYQLQVATSSDFGSGLIVDNNSVADTIFSLSGLVNNVTYYWHVKAQNIVGTSDFSTTYQFTTREGVLYVATTGNDANDGTTASPLRNIQTALNRVLSGDTIKVAAGSYSQVLNTVVSVKLLGGYSSSFLNDERDIFNHKTVIEGISTKMLTDQYASTIDGFIFNGTTSVTDEIITLNNGSVFSHNVVKGIYNAYPTGIRVNGGATVINNTLYVCYWGIDIQSGTGTPNIRNNIIENGSYGMNTYAFSSAVRTYNNVHPLYQEYSGTDQNPGIGDITQDPMFKDADNMDFRLLENSPCVDAGDPGDATGGEMYWNTRIDMGVYGGTKHSPYLPPVPTAAPVLASPIDGAAHQPLDVALVWRATPETSQYHVQVSTDNSFVVVDFDYPLVTDTTKVLTGLALNTTYYWRVCAVVTLGSSEYSAINLFITTPGILCVANSGNDTNDGSTSAPLKNIQTALNQAVSGDTIKVATGSYSQYLNTLTDVVLRGGYDSTFWEGNRHIFKNKTVLNGVSTIVLNDTKASTIDGFVFNGGSSVTDAVVKVYNGSVLIRNVFQNLTATASNNIEVYGGATVVNNTVYNGSAAIEINSGTGTPVIRNNIFSYTSFGVRTLSYDATVRTYNCVFGNTFSYTGFDENPGNGDITLDPLFKNPLDNDFRLLQGSPAIDAGHPDVQYNDPDGSTNDMGAYWYVAPPAAPANLSATAGVMQVTLQWDQNTEADFLRYRIYGGTTANPTVKMDSTTNRITDTSKVITGLTNGVTYYFRITAVDSSGLESGYSNEVGATPLGPDIPPGVPVNLAATAGDMQVTLRWNQNTEPDFLRYRIYGGTTANPIVKMDSTMDGIADTSKVITGLTNGVTYYSRITAVDSSGLESGYSNEVTVTPVGLVAYYPFNGNANDESGSGYNGTENNGVTLVTDRFGNVNSAYSFDGVDDYIDISASSIISFTGDFTTNSWVKVSEADFDFILFGAGSTPTHIMLESGVDSVKLTYHYTDGFSWYANTSDLSFPKNEWAMVSVVRTGNTIKMYINGAISGIFSDIYAGDAGFNMVGGNSSADPSRYLHGSIDDIAIYNVVLTDTEISQLYANYHAPARFSVSSILGQNILTWDSTGYQNLEKVSIYKNGTLLSEVTVDGTEDTLYVDNTITQGTTYSYHITSLDDYGNTSQPSDTLEVVSTPYFSEIDAGIIGVESGSVDLGDYDNDGDLDLLVTGYDGTDSSTKVYRNDGNMAFTEQSDISLPDIHNSSVEWGDYDNDGDLDILLSVTAVYRNDGNNVFTEMTGNNFPGIDYGSLSWGDYNNDGLRDFIVTGHYNNRPVAKIYRNFGDGSFIEQSDISMMGVFYSAVAWGDYDNDNDLDLLISGESSTGYVSTIYQNDGNNIFTESWSFVGVNHASVAWGDYDDDGWLDIVLTGDDGSGLISKIYRNNAGNSFTEQTGIVLPGVDGSSVNWGDFDNDGDTDLLINGNGISETKIFRNEGGNQFNEITDLNLTAVRNNSSTSTKWGDLDNDGDLDILLTGLSTGPISKIYCNNTVINNTPPAAPANLSFSSNDANAVHLNWDAATDDMTPSGALTCNIRVGTTPGGFDIVSPHALSNGKLTLPGMGNAQMGTDFYLKNLAPGTYYWSVQAIDNGYVGGEWATEQSFTFVGQYTVINEAFTKLMQGESKWADYNNDGYLDLIHTGEDIISEKPMAIIYKNNQDNTFSAQSQILLTGIVYSGVDWGDYNNDGYLDILLNGFDGTQNVSVVYKNNGNNTFSRQDGIELPGVIGSNSQWGDYDNDGLLDILLAGYANTGHIARVYRNTGDQTFTEQTQIELIGLHSGHVSWMDLDADNDLDIVLIGSLNEGFKTIIYRNEGANEFTMMDIPSLSGLNAQQAEWADYDSDGDLDVLILGSNGSDNVTQIYQNLGGFIFSLQNQIEFDGVSEGNAQWFDSDNDGDLDVLINGWNGFEFISFIYENKPDQSFVKQSYFGLAGIQKGSSDVVDFDLDGDLDIFLSGESDMGLIAKIYSNQITKPNTKPDAPKNLNSEIHQSQAILSWESGSDAETSSSSLTYNVRIGTTPGSQNVASPAALTDGKITFPGFGNAQLGTSFFINNLKIGTYYWSVQAIDNSYEGGTWSEEQSFKIENSTVHFQVIDFDSVGIPNVTYSINPGNIFSGTSGNNGDIGPHSLPSGIYSLNLNKPGYFNYLNRTIPVLETTFEKKIILPELADYNGDNQVDITDLDSVILNWKSINPVLEMGPVTGILPAFTVEPDQQFDFEDLMVFGLLWDYYNNQKISWQPYSENERDEFQNSGQIVAVLTENFDENALEYSFIWMGSGGFTSNRVLVRYNPDLLIANLTLLLSKENQVLSFNNHDVDKGIVQVTFGVLEDTWIQPGTGLFKISFEKKADTVELPEAYFEYHLGKTIEKGAIQFQEFNQEDLSIFPNPVTKSLTIYCKNAEGIFAVKLFDITGQLIKAIKQQGNQLNLDMQHFPQGILFLEISYGNVKRNVKVIKQ